MLLLMTLQLDGQLPPPLPPLLLMQPLQLQWRPLQMLPLPQLPRLGIRINLCGDYDYCRWDTYQEVSVILWFRLFFWYEKV